MEKIQRVAVFVYQQSQVAIIAQTGMLQGSPLAPVPRKIVTSTAISPSFRT